MGAEYVPIERSERCIRISQEVFGRNTMVYQQEYLERTTKKDLAASVELFLMGRAARTLKGFYPAFPAECFFQGPCSPSFLRDWHNHFDNYGNIISDYCGGISLGRWQDLDTLIEKGIDLETHPVLSLLIAEDMAGLFHSAEDLGYKESLEG